MAQMTYEKEEWFASGYFVGTAANKIRVSKPMVKMPVDVEAYEFLRGLLKDMQYDPETLYNNLQGSGNIIWAPIQSEL
jgi:hypothetical protein